MTENDLTNAAAGAAPERWGPIELLRLWRRLQNLAGDFDLKGFLACLTHVWPPPDWNNSVKVCEWIKSWIGATEMAAELTPTPLDDEAIAALATIVRNDEAWAAWYVLFRSLSSLVHSPVITGADRDRALAVAGIAGVDAEVVFRSARRLAEHVDWLDARPQTQS